MTFKAILGTLAVVALTVASASAGIIEQDFNGYANNTELQNDYDNSRAGLVSSGGVGGSQYMYSTSGTSGYAGTWETTTFDLTTDGTVVTASLFLLNDAAQQGSNTMAGDRAFHFGFEDQDNGDQSLFRLGSTGFTSTTSNWAMELDAEGGGTPQSPSFTVDNGHWYKLDLTFTFRTDSQDIAAIVTDYGTDGQTDSGEVASYNESVTLATGTLGANSKLLIRLAEKDRTGINGYDNLSVVPEPATMSLLALGGLGALLRRRRRA